MTLPIYDILYKTHGIRKYQQLMIPRVWSIANWLWPKRSVYHAVSHNTELLHPDTTSQLFTQCKTRVLTDHIVTLTANKGNPRRNAKTPNILFKQWHQHEKVFKYLPAAAKANVNPLMLTVLNYGYIQDLYKYSIGPLVEYYKWWNIERTVWDNAKKLADETDVHQFIQFDVPDVLPSLTMLKTFSVTTNTSMLKLFSTPSKRQVLELWKWIDPNTRANSTIGELTPDQAGRITLIIRFKEQYALLNLSFLLDWIKQEGSAATESIDSVMGKLAAESVGGVSIAPAMMQKSVLRMLMSMQEQSLTESVPGNTEAPIDGSTGDSIDTDPIAHPDIDDNTNDAANMAMHGVKVSDPQPKDLDGVSKDVDWVSILKNIDNDIAALEIVSAKELELHGVTAKVTDTMPEDNTEGIIQAIVRPTYIEMEEKVFNDLSDQEKLAAAIDEHAGYGMTSPAEYRGMLKQAEAFGNKPSPYDKTKSIKAFAKIDPAELVIDVAKSQLQDSDTVVDKSMLESRLVTFDKAYIKTTMRKDIINMTTSIQRAGVVINDYSVETTNSALGAYEVHTLKVKPIDGAASTLRFKVPVVSPNGEVSINGSKYRQKSQRSDLPIRKINESEVALTSYYGRVFINRSHKKADDSSEWLSRQLFSLGFSETPTVVTNLVPAKVFDNLFKAPKIYTSLARFFKTITVAGYKFYLDHKERINLIAALPNGLTQEATLAKLEGDAYRLIGISPKKEFVLVDYSDELFVYRNNEYVPIGDFYSIALLDKSKSPVDFSVMRVFSKSIPTGLVLSYMLGFHNLLTLLKTKYRVVEGNKRVDLGMNEYVLVFNDCKYVFSRYDQKSALILAGLNDFEKTLKQHPVEAFDFKDIYFAALDDSGIGGRYLKEVDLLDDMFVDPITKELLVKMKEPTTFKGLVVRGSELLTTDYHPDSQDMRYMRIKGYERFSGAIYKELVASVRNYKTRGLRGKSAVELNPYAVWKAISQDSANMLVADINPIENLKQQEGVTYIGAGGRDKGAMNKESRLYHESDKGVISEATVDSGDVAINTFLSANPLFDSVRGTSFEYDFNKNGAASLLSTTALVSPASEFDD